MSSTVDAGHGGGHHDPGRRRLGQLRHEFLDRVGALDALALHRLHRGGVDVIDDAGVPGRGQPPDEVGAHPSQTDHAELHG